MAHTPVGVRCLLAHRPAGSEESMEDIADMFDRIHDYLPQVNSATKYPKIDTYHELDKSNGRLLDNVLVEFSGDVLLTEKVDGTNVRIIILPGGGWIIGSREELIHAEADLVYDAKDGVVDAVMPTAQMLSDREMRTGYQGGLIRVYFLEVYGGRITGAAKQYTTTGAVGVRLLDVAHIHREVIEHSTVEAISSWRKSGGQDFVDERELRDLAWRAGVKLVSAVDVVQSEKLPLSLAGMNDFLERHISHSSAILDAEAGGKPEGLVLRSRGAGPRLLAKVRFGDYRRTLSPPQKGRRAK